MSYTTEIAKDTQHSRVLVRMQPRRRVSTWTLYSGSVYSAPFTWGKVITLEAQLVALTAGTSTSLSAGQFYHDVANGVLYVRKSDSTAPSGSDWLVATFELYFGTEEILWYRDPLDTTTDLVLYRGLVLEAPQSQQSSSLIAFGFFPILASSLKITFDREYLQEILHDSSFYRAPIDIWHIAGDVLSTSNIAAFVSGLANNFKVTEQDIEFSLFDKGDRFDQPVTNPGGTNFWGDAASTNIDPKWQNRPIQTVYGAVDLKGVNLTYKEGGSTSDNRDWGFFCNQLGYGQFNATVTSYTDTHWCKVSLADAALLAEMLALQDYVWVHDGSFSGGGQTLIDTCDTSSGDIHFVSAMTYSVGYKISASSMRNVYLIKAGTPKYHLRYGRDFTELDLSGNVRGIRLTSSAESNAGTSTIAPQTDLIFATCYGMTTLPTANGSPFGSLDGSIVTSAVVIAYHFLKDRLGFAESEIDLTQFSALLGANAQKVNFAVPDSKNDDFGSFKDIVTRIFTTLLIKAYFDPNGKLVLKEIAAAGAPSATVTDEELIQGSFQADYSYDDLNAVVVSTPKKEISFVYSKAAILAGSKNTNFTMLSDDQPTTTVQADSYTYLHKGTRSINVDALSDQSPFIDRIKLLAGERSGRITLIASVALIQRAINDSMEITRSRLPGFAFDATTDRTRRGSIVDMTRSKDGVTIILDDQKAVVDNPGSW